MALKEAACDIGNIKVVVAGADIARDIQFALDNKEGIRIMVESESVDAITTVLFYPTELTHDLRSMKAFEGVVAGDLAYPASVIVTPCGQDSEAILVIARQSSD